MQINSEKFRALANQMLFNSELPYTLPYNQSTFSLDGSSDDWEKLQTAIGQGKTQITPLHNLMIVSAIANGGTLMKPYMIMLKMWVVRRSRSSFRPPMEP